MCVWQNCNFNFWISRWRKPWWRPRLPASCSIPQERVRSSCTARTLSNHTPSLQLFIWTKLLPGCKKVNNHQFLPSRGKLKSAQMKLASNSKAGDCAPGSWSHQCQSQRGPSWLQWVQFCNSLYMMRGNSNPNIQFEKNINLRGLLMTKQSLGMQQVFLWLMGVRKWVTTLTNNMTLIC